MLRPGFTDPAALQMPTLPIPFFAALLLVVFFVQVAWRNDGAPARRPLLMLIGVCIVQSLLFGLRWGYGVQAAQFVIPVLAAALPPLVFLSLGRLSQTGPEGPWDKPWLHALPPLLLAALVLFQRGAIDYVLTAIYLGYALALLRRSGRGPDALGSTVFESVVPTHRALRIASVVLLASAAVDTIVAFDFVWTQGKNAPAIVGLASVLELFLLGLAATLVGLGPASPDAGVAAPAVPRNDAEDDLDVVARVDELMRTRDLFSDANLNLNRLARRAGLPARRVSAAVNRVHAKNVSQYINGYRIAEACRLLTETDRQVTGIMLEVGFHTKSNFNREFRRITGMSPLEWRARSSEGA